ncbi:MAG TPA: sialidase family protein, partial [Methylomirabilota bacterium]|nr:sialidase family protein [Methylomirabilota bacterium]
MNSAAGKAHRLRFSRLAGDRWAPAVTIASGPNFFANWADFPAVIAAPDGSLMVHWLEKAGPGAYAYGIKLARSTDGGATWSPSGSLHPEAAASEYGFVSWLSEGKAVRGVWLDGRELKGMSEKDGAMTLRTAALRGGKVESDERIDGRVCSCCQTDAALAAGGPVIA